MHRWQACGSSYCGKDNRDIRKRFCKDRRSNKRGSGVDNLDHFHGIYACAQGFVVLAVEHADGSASTVKLAGKAGHKFYGGWLSEEERLGQTRRVHRLHQYHLPSPDLQ